MDVNEVREHFRERLEKLDLTLEIEKDDSDLSYLDEFRLPVKTIARKGKCQGDIETSLFWDLDQPYNKGFHKNSLFLYLNDRETLKKWMLDGFQDSKGKRHNEIKCVKQERALGHLIAGRKILLDNDFSAESVFDACKEFDKALYGISGNSPEDIAFWLCQSLPLERYGHSLDDTKFNAEKECAKNCECPDPIGTAAISAFVSRFNMLNSWENPGIGPKDAREFMDSLDEAIKGLSDFMELHRESLGGALFYIDYVKKGYAQKFGSPEPFAHAGIRCKTDDCEASLASSGESDFIILMHKNLSGKNIGEAMSDFNDIVANVLDELNGNVFCYNILNRKGHAASSGGEAVGYGFVGTDMEKNGILHAVSESLEYFEETLNPPKNRGVLM